MHCCQDAVQKPFEARQRAGRERLMALLSRIMIRAAKSDLVTIPACHHKVPPHFIITLHSEA